jgi:GNAT superfamily N-acetyltransferase
MHLTNPEYPSEEEFEALKQGLTSFNEAATGKVYREKVSCFVKDDQGIIWGGIVGEINWNWLHVQGFWLDADIRELGWGSKLLSSLESYAKDNNVANVRLETTSFQALDFYLKLSYTVFATLPDMPLGHTSYFLKKHLL